MKVLKTLLVFVLLITFSLFPLRSFAEEETPAVTSSPEDASDEENETEAIYYDNGCEVIVEKTDLVTGEELPRDVIADIADGTLRGLAHFEDNLREGFEGTGSFDSVPYQNDPGSCQGGGTFGCTTPHNIKNTRVCVIQHCFLAEDPRCIECNYFVSCCTREGCGFMQMSIDYSRPIRRISCHSGTQLKDWEVYDNYLYYKRDASRKISGYTTEYATVYLTRSFLQKYDAVDPDYFDKIKDVISSVEYQRNSGYAVIRFNFCDAGTELNASDIDRYIAALKYLDSLFYVGSVVPSYKTEKYEEPRSSENNEPGQDETTDRSEEPFETAEAAPSDTSEEHAIDTSAEPPAEKAEGAVKTYHNPQTGDPLAAITAAAVASFAVMIAAVMILRRRVNNKQK